MKTINSRQYIIPKWPAPSCIKAFCTTREGGTSLTPFHSFNLADHVGDGMKHVEQNRQLLCKDLNLNAPISWLRQTHTNRAIELPYDNNDLPADAVITQKEKLVCAVLTADCIPLLLCNTDGTEVAAIHAGWQGLYNGIIDKTIAKMTSPSTDLLVWLGPAISQDAFEVDTSWAQRFIDLDSANQKAIQKRGHKIFADLYQITRNQLCNLGIKKTYGAGYCTFKEKNRFFSYRGESTTGRMASGIYIQS